MDLFADIRLAAVVSTLFWSLLSVGIFVAAFAILDRISPFSIRKEIGDDHNVALGVIVGSVILGLAIILAAILSS